MNQGLHRFSEPMAATVFSAIGISHRFTVAAHPPHACVVPRQGHGIEVVESRCKEGAKQLEGDGLFLRGSGTIGVSSADCLPILLASGDRTLVLALHAGWRSLAGGIVQQAAKIWHHVSLADTELYAVLGPTLCARHFEVGPDVVVAFRAPQLGLLPEDFSCFVEAGKGDRSHISLNEAAVVMLIRLGLSPARISLVDSCTFCHPERWPSWRRDHALPQHIWSSVSL